jgi:hypothetical protein
MSSFNNIDRQIRKLEVENPDLPFYKILRRFTAEQQQIWRRGRLASTKRADRTQNTAPVVSSKNKVLSFFTRKAANKAPNKKPVVRQAVGSHAGWEKVATKGDGNCMFHSVYYAWFPEEGVDAANRTQNAEEIRRIVSEFVTLDDLYGGQRVEGITELNDMTFKPESLNDSIRMANEKEKARLVGYKKLYEDILRSNESKEAKEDLILKLYKQVILERTFWGDNRELNILNRYAREIGLPPIMVWADNMKQFIQPVAGARPIHFNGYNHYSILKEINSPNAKAARNALNAKARGREGEFAEAEADQRRKEQIAIKRVQLTQAAFNAFRRKGGDEGMGKTIRNIIGEYFGEETANSTANYAHNTVRELGGSDEQANAVRQSIFNTLHRGGGKTRRSKNRLNT